METPNAAVGSGQSATPAPTGQAGAAPTKEATPNSAPTGQADAGNKAPNLEGADSWEYDGNLNSVPPQFQKFAKGLQKHFTQRSMTDAETRRKGQEYDAFVASDDFRNFQAWKQQSQQGQPVQGQQPTEPRNPNLINQQEWEDALLDSSGSKAQNIIDRVVQARLNQAVQMYGGQLAQLQKDQQKAKFENTLSSFADVNPDVLELHEMGLMKPLLQEEMQSGRHKTHEAAINAAYQRSVSARDAIKAKLIADQTKMVAQKREAITENGSTSGDSSVVYVDKNDAFATAFENAMQGKKVKNRLK